MISPASPCDPFWVVDTQRPAAYIDFMRAIIERFARAINSEPVPVIRMHIVLIGTPWNRSLPQVPIQLRRHRHFFAYANRLPRIDVPGFREVCPPDNTVVNFLHDLDGVG